ncbi:MAG: hypothetical protein ABH810_03365 [bacterium]
MGLINLLLNKWMVLGIGGVLMIVGLLPEYTLKAVRMIGMMGWAEQSIGRGGTFSVWKVIGILAPIAAIIYFFTPSIQIHLGDDTQNQTNYQYDNSYNSTDSYYQ